METSSNSFFNLEYINLENLDYFFEIKDEIFDPASSFSAFEENKLPEKRSHKMEKSVISTMSSKTSKSKLSKKAKKNQQKKKLKEKELDLELSKKDSKNGIYSIKPIKEKPQKKEKNQKNQKTDDKKQQQIKQKMMDELIKETKKIVENVVDNEMEKIQKNKKKNKNKKKEKEKEREEKEEKKHKTKEEKEGNKQVDDFIKSIKEKKEKKEKEIQQENIKLLFYNKYKYAFIFDPTNRLKLRDESMLIDDDIINDLFSIISTNTKNVDNKEIIKELLILLDSFAEILFSTQKNRENKDGIELFLMNCIKFNNQIFKDYSDENKFIMIINVFYTMMKMKIELEKEYENIFDKIYDEINEDIIFKELEENIKSNDKYDIKDNIKLINILFCFLLTEFFNKKEEKNIVYLNELIKLYSILFNTKKKEQKDEIYQDENLDLFKEKYNSITILMKLYSLFDIKRSNFFSLNIKVSKAFEDFLKSLDQLLLNNNTNIYLSMILNLIQQYIYNMDLFYELDSNLYEKIFNLIQILIENPPFNDLTNENIYSEKNKFIENLKLNELSLNSDDSISKYQILLLKLFKFYDTNNKKDEYNPAYIKYFQKVLNFTFEISQHYLKEKYISLLQRELKTKIDNCQNILEVILNEIFEKINKILDTKSITLIKNYKNVSKFYGIYEKFIDKIISYIKNNYSEKEKIEENDEIKIILLISMMGNNNKMIEKFVEEMPCKIILFIDQKMINYIMLNYLEEETNILNSLIKEYFIKKKEECQEAIMNKFLNELKNNNIYKVVEIWNLIIEQKINIDLNKINEMKNDDNYKIVDGIILYMIINDINNEKMSEIYKLERDFIKEIQDVNDINGHFKANGYIQGSKLNNLINVLVKLNDLNIVLKKDPKYFRPYKPIITEEKNKINIDKEKIEENKKEEKKEENQIKEEKNEEKIEENKDENQIKEEKKEDKKEENKIEEKKEENQIKEERKEEKKEPHINMDIILHIFSEILSMKEIKSIKEKITDKNREEKLKPYNLSTLFYFSYIENYIFYLFSNDDIFSNLKKSPKFLSAYITLYISYKENFKQSKIYFNDYLTKNKSISQLEIKNILIFQKTLNDCEINLTNLLITRCSSQLVYLFPEKEIYNLLQTNNIKFLKTVTDKLAEVYKTQILSEENVKILLNKAQDEEVDYLNDVIYSIFGKETIKYLEDPKDIIKTLVGINEGMKYDLLPNKNNFVNSIYPYFYIWKAIMMKIEYGFKLYTTDKSKTELIENYKTLLRFIISYLEKNSLLYDMFLLILVSLIHLIDQQDYENDIDNSDPINNDFQNFDENNLTNEFDHNTYIFLLSILYKFVKIFPSLIKYYYDGSQNKLRYMFKNLIFSQILPKLITDIRKNIKSNEKILLDNGIILKEAIVKNIFEFSYQLNEEIALMINIKIPPIFPLKKLEVNVRCNAQLNETKLFNIKMNLNHTLNSSLENICDNLIIWSEDAKQLVVLNNEPCPICFYYVNSTDKSLPSLQCHTCKKKFHSFCIKEWFKSQEHLGKETCPMCRGEWKLKLRR